MPRSVSTATNMTVMTTFTDASGPSTAAGALHGLTWPYMALASGDDCYPLVI